MQLTYFFELLVNFLNGVILTPKYCLRNFFHRTAAGLKHLATGRHVEQTDAIQMYY